MATEIDTTNNSTTQLPMKALSELMSYTFIIPSQQRGYKWTPKNIQELLADFLEFINSPSKKPMYCLQPLAVVKEGDNRYSVIDGQQRLTTLYLLYRFLFHSDFFKFEFERDEEDDIGTGDCIVNRWDFLSKIESAEAKQEAKASIDTFFIFQAFKTIKESLSNEDSEKLRTLLKAGKTDKQSVQVIWYEVEKAKAHETFRNLNSGKIALTNTELIKALFLNRVSGLELREEAAAQFEEMEQRLHQDRFWYMFNKEDVRPGQDRLDAIFNIVARCTDKDYQNEPRTSFHKYFDKGNSADTLEEKWQKVRRAYLQLSDLFDNIYTYHYIGFLTYCGAHGCSTRELLKEMSQLNKSEFKEWLEKKIAGILKSGAESLEKYFYSGNNTVHLRRLFVIYNIETILTRYDQLCRHRGLQFDFERFPFELLNTQDWDIEHITPQTDAPLDKYAQQQEWLDATKADLGDKYAMIKCEEDEKQYFEKPSEKSFKRLYNKIVEYLDNEHSDTIPEEVDGPSEDGQYKDKNQLGNLTLLDRHTNISYHNALFPTKRRFVITVDGLRTSQDSTDIFYVPPTTRQVFTKSYSRGSDVNLSYWGQKDADAYFADIKLKLQKYFQ